MHDSDDSNVKTEDDGVLVVSKMSVGKDLRYRVVCRDCCRSVSRGFIVQLLSGYAVWSQVAATMGSAECCCITLTDAL